MSPNKKGVDVSRRTLTVADAHTHTHKTEPSTLRVTRSVDYDYNTGIPSPGKASR